MRLAHRGDSERANFSFQRRRNRARPCDVRAFNRRRCGERDRDVDAVAVGERRTSSASFHTLSRTDDRHARRTNPRRRVRSADIRLVRRFAQPLGRRVAALERHGNCRRQWTMAREHGCIFWWRTHVLV